MENASPKRFGITVALVVGLVTAIAATLAVVAKGKSSEFKALDLSDNWDEVLGI